MARKKKYDYYDDSFKATAVELGELGPYRSYAFMLS